MQKRPINKLIIHVSDSPDSRNISMKDISRWHKEMNFPKSSSGLYCGYHYVICRDGTLEQARPESEAGAHTKGHNKDSIGVCWVGRDQMSSEQRKTLVKFCVYICERYSLEAKHVFGHREFNDGKTCPNIKDLDKLRDEIEIELGAKIGTGTNR